MVFGKIRGMTRDEDYENDNGDYLEVGMTDIVTKPAGMIELGGKVGIKMLVTHLMM